jgi:hypothetical protein
MDWEELQTQYVSVFKFSEEWATELQEDYSTVIHFLEETDSLGRFSPSLLFNPTDEIQDYDSQIKTAIQKSNITLLEVSLFSINFVETVRSHLPSNQETARELYAEIEASQFPLTEKEFIHLCTVDSFFNPKDLSFLELSKEQFVFETKPEVGEKWEVKIKENNTPYIVEVVGFEERSGPESQLYDPYCLAKLISIDGKDTLPKSPVLHLEAVDFNNGKKLD